MTGHFRDESFLAINCTGTDNQTQQPPKQNKQKYLLIHTKPTPTVASCSYQCAYDCTQLCHTIQHRTVL